MGVSVQGYTDVCVTHDILQGFRIHPGFCHIRAKGVQLATEDNQFGWTRESRLLPKVVPDDPVSQLIMTFSNTHLLFRRPFFQP